VRVTAVVRSVVAATCNGGGVVLVLMVREEGGGYVCTKRTQGGWTKDIATVHLMLNSRALAKHALVAAQVLLRQQRVWMVETGKGNGRVRGVIENPCQPTD